jgi:hypothetical protein
LLQQLLRLYPDVLAAFAEADVVGTCDKLDHPAAPLWSKLRFTGAGVTKTVLQAALDAEMADHPVYEKGERPPFPTGNHRNGSSAKTVLTEVAAPGQPAGHRSCGTRSQF